MVTKECLMLMTMGRNVEWTQISSQSARMLQSASKSTAFNTPPAFIKCQHSG